MDKWIEIGNQLINFSEYKEIQAPVEITEESDPNYGHWVIKLLYKTELNKDDSRKYICGSTKDEAKKSYDKLKIKLCNNPSGYGNYLM